LLIINSKHLKHLFLCTKQLPLRLGDRNLQGSYSKTLVVFGDVYFYRVKICCFLLLRQAITIWRSILIELINLHFSLWCLF